MTITKDTVIGDLVREDIRYAQILMMNGMGCVGCPASQAETIQQAALVHNLDLDSLLEDLNAFASESEEA